jgi:hypothetical protein
MKITFDWLEEHEFASVTDYCRALVKQDPGSLLGDKIEVYRGDMLCLTVTDINVAAGLEPASSGWQKYTGKRLSNGHL